MDYLVFYHTFVNVFIPFAQLLDIDVVQQIFILEHLDRLKCPLIVRNGHAKVIRHFALIMVGILGNLSFQGINGQAEIGTKLNIEFSLLDIFHLRDNYAMVGKAYAQEGYPWEVREIRQL